jgi:hypothetical protein
VSEAPGKGAAKLHYSAFGLAGGGAIAIMGVALGWWEYSFPLPGGVQTTIVRGTEDWTGVLCMMFGFLAIYSGIALLVDDAQMRKIGTALGVAVSLLVLVTAIVGLFRADAVVGTPQPLGGTLGEGGLTVSDVSTGIYVSIVGGIIATVSAVLATRDR